MNANDFVILNHEKFLSDFFLVPNVNMHKIDIYLLRDGKYILVIVKWKKKYFPDVYCTTFYMYSRLCYFLFVTQHPCILNRTLCNQHLCCLHSIKVSVGYIVKDKKTKPLSAVGYFVRLHTSSVTKMINQC